MIYVKTIMKKIIYEGLPEGLYELKKFKSTMDNLDGSAELASSFNEDDGDLSVLWYGGLVVVRLDYYPGDKKSRVTLFGDEDHIIFFEKHLKNPILSTKRASSKRVYSGDDTTFFGIEPFMNFMDSLPGAEIVSETGTWASGVYDYCHMQWLQRPGVVVSYSRVDKRIRQEGNLVGVRLIGDWNKIGVLEQTILDEAKKL